MVQQSVTEAIQQIPGLSQATETSSDATTSKSQFVSVAAPLGFTQGFNLDCVGERKSSFAPNLSSQEFPRVIDSKVASEVALGCTADQFDTPTLDPLWVSPGGSTEEN